jgi:hypothetical protein
VRGSPGTFPLRAERGGDHSLGAALAASPVIRKRNPCVFDFVRQVDVGLVRLRNKRDM